MDFNFQMILLGEAENDVITLNAYLNDDCIHFFMGEFCSTTPSTALSSTIFSGNLMG